ncbi:transcription antitermination factor NusB [Brachybacterium sp. EF45031]|nr:transcription antitermination factor NusB [Brachybacterium sillae]
MLPQGYGDGDLELVRTEDADTRRFSSRTKDRVRALDVLFEADARQLPVLEVLEQRRVRTAAQTPLPPRSQELVQRYAEHAAEADEQISTHSRGWSLERMPAVDRAILRLGAVEVMVLASAEETGAVIGEYVRIAQALSTDDSPRFVNGLLQRLADLRGMLG